MRLRDQVAGTLNLFSAGNTPLSPPELRTAQALNSLVVIEQAKGRLAEHLCLTMDQAFTLPRQHARNTNQRLTDVARYVIDSPTADFPSRPAGEPGGQTSAACHEQTAAPVRELKNISPNDGAVPL